MQDGSNSKQLIAEKIKQSANILVTVSSNPSVDALTAALGLTLMLNKLDKHATAVFSGVIPPAINFLEPNKTFENNVDSLRDFIIALDKDKADRLRYKVEDDVVRIFITPYRTKISQSDLQFSQGDFNVDLIVALGVEDQKDLDQAITAHGRILHDATVVTVNAAAQKSSLGSIDWQDKNASSLSEMLASLSEMLKPGILDQQISTALLTGIVANTERFSNQQTTPHVMTMAAQLMAAGANQQLIATKLQSIPAPVSPRREGQKPQISEQSKKVTTENEGDGEMHINHGEEQAAALPAENLAPVPPAPTPESEPEPELPIAPPPAQNFADLKQAIQEETVQAAPQRDMAAEPEAPGSHNINDAENDEAPKPEEESYLTTHPSWQGREIKPPTMGGTLNATAEQALQDKLRAEQEEKRNHTILTHGAGAPGGQATGQQQPSSSKRKRNKKKSSSQQNQNQPQPQAPVAPPPAPAPEPVELPEAPAAAEPAPAPEPLVEPQEPTPVAPMPEAAPAPLPEPEEPVSTAEEPAPGPAPQAEIPVAPPPLVVSEPLTPPAPVEPSAPAPQPASASMPPAPAPMPDPAMPPAPAAHEPTLEELEREAVSHAAQSAAPQTLSELEAARQQANAALTPPTPQVAPAPMPEVVPQQAAPAPIEPAPAPQPTMPQTGLPPLPPMPDFGSLPPIPGAPQMPQQPQPLTPQTPAAAPQPPQPLASPTPPPTPADPGQFRIPGQ